MTLAPQYKKKKMYILMTNSVQAVVIIGLHGTQREDYFPLGSSQSQFYRVWSLQSEMLSDYVANQKGFGFRWSVHILK